MAATQEEWSVGRREQLAPLTRFLVSEAWSFQDRFGFSWWDALIVEAAQAGGSALLLSEGFQDGLQIDNLRVVDPFKQSPAAVADGFEG
jgi:predicted nucleic acid-binding protein